MVLLTHDQRTLNANRLHVGVDAEGLSVIGGFDALDCSQEP